MRSPALFFLVTAALAQSPAPDLNNLPLAGSGITQPIRMFVSPAAPPVETPPVAPAPAGALPASPHIFSNHDSPAARSNPTIFLIDEGLAKWEEKLFACGRIIRLLKQLPPGEQIGLYTPYGYGVGIAHEFTRDQSELVHVIEQWNIGAANALMSIKSVQNADRHLDPQPGLDAHFYCQAATALIAITASKIRNEPTASCRG